MICRVSGQTKMDLVDARVAQCQYDDLLERAVLHGTLEDVRNALALGANPDGQPYELAPLFRACIHRSNDGQRHEIVRLLLAAGADVNCEYNGRSLLANVERMGRQDLVRLLLDYGARQELDVPLPRRGACCLDAARCGGKNLAPAYVRRLADTCFTSQSSCQFQIPARTEDRRSPPRSLRCGAYRCTGVRATPPCLAAPMP